MNHPLQVTAKGLSEPGQKRTHNEDRFHINNDYNLYIVADGMGGHLGGEVASSLTAYHIASHFISQSSKESSYSQEEKLCHALNRACLDVYQTALENPPLNGMGSTATALHIDGDRAYLGHVGDSRLYLIRHGLIYQMTNDHTLLREQKKTKNIPNDTSAQQLEGILSRFIGSYETEIIDSLSFKVEAEDKILLCSDGLYNLISDQTISQTVEQHGADACPLLVDLANAAGGTDNITGICLEIR